MTKFIPSSEDGRRLKELDILRAIAVILVLGRHLLEIPETISPFIRTTLSAWRDIGWIGVDLFFVLSGFLVAGVLFREYQTTQSLHISRFLIRRGFKIYPPFYVLLGVTYVFASSLPLPQDLRRYLGELLFLQNYVGAVWNHTWSLAVEEHFYILLATIIFILVRRNRGAENPFQFLPVLLVSTMTLVLILRCAVGSLYPVGEWGLIIIYTHFRIDSLLSGVMLAYLSYFKSDFLESVIHSFGSLLLWFALCSISIPLWFPLSETRISYTLGFTFIHLGFGALLMLILFSRSAAKGVAVEICAPVLVPIGRASYSIYLWHMLVYYLSAYLVKGYAPSTSLFLLRFLIYLIGSILVGLLMFRLVEQPFLRIRDRFCPKTRLSLVGRGGSVICDSSHSSAGGA